MKSSVKLFSADVDVSSLPTEFLLWKAGVNETKHGDVVYDASRSDEMRSFDRRPKVAIDVEHMSLGATTVEQAEAIGWFVIDFREDGIWATQVEWLDKGQQLLSSKRFRYISPVIEFFLDADSGSYTNVIRYVLNVAVTNIPATAEPTALVASAQGRSMQEDEDKAKQLNSIDPTDEDDEKKDEQQNSEGDGDLPPMTDEEKDEALTALQSQVKTLQEENDALRAENEQLKAAKDDEEVDEGATKESIAASLIQGGKLTPAMKPWFLTLSLTQANAYSKLHGTDPSKALVKGRVQIKTPDQLNSVVPKAITEKDVAPPVNEPEDVKKSPIYRALRGIR